MDRRITWFLLLALCMAGWVAPPRRSMAAEFWVSPLGDDAGPGSKDRPFQTIRRGANRAAAGDVVFVRAGRYEEHVKVSAPTSDTPPKRITICAARAGLAASRSWISGARRTSFATASSTATTTTPRTAATDLLGQARAKDGVCSLGCYEGGYSAGPADRPEPGVEIAPGQDVGAIQALLANSYDLDWRGMLQEKPASNRFSFCGVSGSPSGGSHE